MQITVIIPAFNEQANIEKVIKRTKNTINAKIVVINDGSFDKTKELAEKSGAIVISHSKNLGKGEALNTGFNYARQINSTYIVVVDADLQFYPEDIQKLLEPLKNNQADFIMGSRNWKHVPFRHRLGNWTWKTLFNFLFNTNLNDTNSGFIALNQRALNIVQGMYGGYIVENSMLIQLIKNNLKILNVPVQIKYHRISPIPRGIRIVSGIFLFILNQGIKYRLKCSSKS